MAGAIFLIAIDCKVWRFEDHCAHRPAGISGRTQLATSIAEDTARVNQL